MANVTYDWAPALQGLQGLMMHYAQKRQYEDLLKTLGTGMGGGLAGPFGGPSSAPPLPTQTARREDDNGMPIPGLPAPIQQAQGGGVPPGVGQGINPAQPGFADILRKLPPQIGMPLLLQTMQQQMNPNLKDVDPTHDIIDSRGNVVRKGVPRAAASQRKYETINGIPGWVDENGFTPDPNGPAKAPDAPTKTTSQQNAEALGLKPGTKEYNDYIRADTLPQTGSGAQQPPSGYRWGKNGTLEFIPGGPADPAVAGRGTGRPTEDQAKNSQLYNRAKEQLPIVLENFDALGTVQSVIADNIPGIGGYLGGEKYQRADGALKDIAASYLYSVSGATATPSEIAGTVERVRPKATDSAQTKADKKKRIQDMVESIAQRAGPGLNAPSAAPQGKGPQVGTVEDGYRFKGGNPADPASWEKVR